MSKTFGARNKSIVLFKAPDLRLERAANDDLRAEIIKRMELFKCDALEALHHLAMMDVDMANPMMAEVKLRAATQLCVMRTDSNTGPGMPGESGDSVLEALNAAYHAAAPRIRSIRERTVTFEGGGETKEVAVIEAPTNE